MTSPFTDELKGTDRHGRKRTRHTWDHMIKRCTNPSERNMADDLIRRLREGS